MEAATVNERSPVLWFFRAATVNERSALLLPVTLVSRFYPAIWRSTAGYPARTTLSNSAKDNGDSSTIRKPD